MMYESEGGSQDDSGRSEAVLGLYRRVVRGLAKQPAYLLVFGVSALFVLSGFASSIAVVAKQNIWFGVLGVLSFTIALGATIIVVRHVEREGLHPVNVSSLPKPGEPTLTPARALTHEFINYLLRGIRHTYLAALAEQDVSGRVQIRVSIMAPDGSSDGAVTIYFCDHKSEYTVEELRGRWLTLQGQAGLAWHTNQQHAWAIDGSDPRHEFQDMGERSANVKDLKSVISTPLEYEARRIGLLNVDSYQPGAASRLHTVLAENIFARAATEIAPTVERAVGELQPTSRAP